MSIITTSGSSGGTPPAERQTGSATSLSDNSTSASAASTGASWQWLFWAAAVIVIVYIIFALLAFGRADDKLAETDWSRSVYVLLGVEAIAFTAVGWLFGREVHRGEAQAAKQDAAQAKSDAKEQRSNVDGAKEKEAGARERAVAAEVKGRALADAMRAAGPNGSASIGGDERTGDRGAPAPGVPPMDALRGLADSLFPPQ
jgi:hypothetical protein